MGMLKDFYNNLPWNVYASREKELNKLAKELFGEQGIYKDDRFQRYDSEDMNPADFDLDVYDKMLKDGQVKAGMDIIKLASTSKGFTVTGDDEETKEYAKFINDNFKQMKGNMEDILGEMLSALDYGYSATEKVFEYKDGKIMLRKLKVLDPHSITVKTDKFGDIMHVKQSVGSKQIKIKPDKIIWYAHEGRFGNQYGNSMLRTVYKHWYIKDKMYRFANIAYERYGTPLLVGQVQDAKDTSKMNDLLRNINGMTGLSISGGDKVEAIQGSNADFVGYIEHHDRKIMESLLVPPMMLGLSRGQGGSYALSGNQFDIFMIRLEALQRDLKALMEEEVIRPLIDLNFPNVKNYPTFNFKPIAERDAQKISSVIDTMVRLDVIAPSEDWIREELGFPQPSEDALKEIEKRKEERAKQKEVEEGAGSGSKPEGNDPYADRKK